MPLRVHGCLTYIYIYISHLTNIPFISIYPMGQRLFMSHFWSHHPSHSETLRQVEVNEVDGGHPFDPYPSGAGYPLVMINVAIENTPFMVDLPIQNGDFL